AIVLGRRGQKNHSALIKPKGVISAEFEDALACGEGAAGLNGIAQRLAELLRAWLGHLLCNRDRPLQDRHGIMDVRAKLRTRPGTELLLVSSYVIQAFLFRLRSIVLEFRNHHRAGGEDGVLRRFACDTQEVEGYSAMRLVNGALKTAL